MSWIKTVSARKERAAKDKIGVSKERDFYDNSSDAQTGGLHRKARIRNDIAVPATELANWPVVLRRRRRLGWRH